MFHRSKFFIDVTAKAKKYAEIHVMPKALSASTSVSRRWGCVRLPLLNFFEFDESYGEACQVVAEVLELADHIAGPRRLFRGRRSGLPDLLRIADPVLSLVGGSLLVMPGADGLVPGGMYIVWSDSRFCAILFREDSMGSPVEADPYVFLVGAVGLVTLLRPCKGRPLILGFRRGAAFRDDAAPSSIRARSSVGSAVGPPI